MVYVACIAVIMRVEALMAAAPPSDQLGALQWFAPPLLHVYPAPAQSFPDLKTTLLLLLLRRTYR